MREMTVLAGGLLAATAVLAACVGDEPGTSSGSTPEAGATGETGAACAKRSGTFVSTFSEKVGTCGAYRTLAGSDERTVTISEQAVGPEAPCTGAFTYGADNCTETVETSCPSVDPNAAMTTRGTLTWNVEGTRAVGDLEVSTSSCKSTYAVVTTKK